MTVVDPGIEDSDGIYSGVAHRLAIQDFELTFVAEGDDGRNKGGVHLLSK